MDLYKRIGQRIREAREAMSYSQEELGQLIGGYSGTAISYFESGVRKVKIDDLKKISQILQKSIDYFIEDEEVDETVAITMRAKELLHPGAFETIKSFVQEIKQRQAPSSRPMNLEGISPRLAANKLLTELKVNSPPIPLDQAAELAGVHLIERPFSDEISALLIRGNHVLVIGVNKHHAETRKRFSIAHELGHSVLGHNEQLFIEFSTIEMEPSHNRKHREQEREANWFAAEFLMPANMVRDDYKKFGGDVSKLADLYKVSQQAMWIRLSNLRLVKEQVP